MVKQTYPPDSAVITILMVLTAQSPMDDRFTRDRLARKAVASDLCLKLTGWRLRSYPLEIYAGKKLIWSGETERSLGYVHLKPAKPVATNEITIRLKGAGKDKDAFGGIVEVAEPAAGELDLFKAKGGEARGNELRIVEIEFLTPTT